VKTIIKLFFKDGTTTTIGLDYLWTALEDSRVEKVLDLRTGREYFPAR
jgi:hypothetical protein